MTRATDGGEGTDELALCVATFTRPVGLARLLDHLAGLAVPASLRLRLIVVDNDANGTAEPVVRAATDALPFAVEYVIEPERGISQARNRAVAAAGDVDWIGFVDDDDWPEPDWLVRLVATQEATDADVVVGPTTPVFESEPPAWMLEGDFFASERFPSRLVVPFNHARTGGVLIRRSVLAELGPRPFADVLGAVGGEDSALFKQLEDNGARICWDDEAIYHEVIPDEKASTRWLLARSFRIGVARSLLLVRIEHQGWPRRIKRLGAAAATVGRGGIALVRARDTASRVHALQLVTNGVGLAAGVLGYRYEEYKVVRGR